VFAYGAINAYLTSTWIAKEQGFFSKYNFEVQPVFIIATQAAQAMLAGEVQFGLIGPTHVINAVAAGGDMVMIMGNQNRVRYQLIAHPSIKRPEDLKGKTFGIAPAWVSVARGVRCFGSSRPEPGGTTSRCCRQARSHQLGGVEGDDQTTVIAPEISKAAVAEGFPIFGYGQLNIPFRPPA
jgi:hypothetical protein